MHKVSYLATPRVERQSHYLEVEGYQGENKRFEILYQVIEYPQSLWIRRFRDVDQRTNLRSLVCRASAGYPLASNWQNGPRRICVRSQAESPAPGDHLCSSLATSSRLPFDCSVNVDFCCSDWPYFMISLSLMIRFISAIRSELTHTASVRHWKRRSLCYRM